MHVAHFASPVGTLEVKEERGHIMWLGFSRSEQATAESSEVLDACLHQLGLYFAGGLKEFDLPLAPGGTPFQQRVWSELTAIPFGHSVSYSEIARRLGDAKSVRAVGLANGKNPIAIIIPCHRVIGEHGSLTGYAGGLKRKKWLLEHESSQTSLF